MIKLLDCTLRDGGYYNYWDFSDKLIHDYLQAMVALEMDFVEIGFRSLKNIGFKGGCAFSTDNYISSLDIPIELKDKIGVMINGSELLPKISQTDGLVSAQAIAEHQKKVLSALFSVKEKSPVTLVRIACHLHEFEHCLPVANWLSKQGYLVGFNLMQIAGRPEQEISNLAALASNYPIDVLYFADSMGSLTPEQTSKIIGAFKQNWGGALGIHTHDNMGQALANSLQAVNDGVSWVDCTVTGMGRGPGNVQTEYLVIALESFRPIKINFTQLFQLIREHFKPMQAQYGWGTNPYYYLAGKFGIHPSYIQEMLSDNRYSDEDLISVIEHLKAKGAEKFTLGTLESARHFYSGDPKGTWQPSLAMEGKDVLIIGAGPGVIKYRKVIEEYIKQCNPYVIALNTQNNIDGSLIDIRAACHPVRLLADCHEYLNLPQPLVTPASMLPKDIQIELKDKVLLDFGITIQAGDFKIGNTFCTLPSLLVFAYAIAIATSGKAKKIHLAGFDGYDADDPRRKEVDKIMNIYKQIPTNIPIESIVPTRYEIPEKSIYALDQAL